MKDLAIRLPHRPGALAELGEALGKAGISIEGGGAFAIDGGGLAHFLVADAAAAREAPFPHPGPLPRAGEGVQLAAWA